MIKFSLKWWWLHSNSFFEQNKLSFDDFLMMTWVRENESERKKEPEILRLIGCWLTIFFANHKDPAFLLSRQLSSLAIVVEERRDSSLGSCHKWGGWKRTHKVVKAYPRHKDLPTFTALESESRVVSRILYKNFRLNVCLFCFCGRIFRKMNERPFTALESESVPRTTNARWGNRLHRTAENQLALPSF